MERPSPAQECQREAGVQPWAYPELKLVIPAPRVQGAVRSYSCAVPMPAGNLPDAEPGERFDFLQLLALQESQGQSNFADVKCR